MFSFFSYFPFNYNKNSINPKKFVDVMEQKGGYCFVPMKYDGEIPSKDDLKNSLLPTLVSIDSKRWPPENLKKECESLFKYSAIEEDQELISQLHDAISNIGSQVLKSFNAEQELVICRVRNKFSGDDYVWHVDKADRSFKEKIGLVFSYELIKGKGTCFKNGDKIISPEPGEASIFLMSDEKNIEGTIHSAPPNPEREHHYDPLPVRVLLLIGFPVNKSILESPKFLEWVNVIDGNHRVKGLPGSIASSSEAEAEVQFLYDGLITGLIVGELLKPGIRCVTSKVKGENSDNFCIDHYQQAASSLHSSKTIAKAVVSEVIFGTSLYLESNLVNALILRKMSYDITEVAMEGEILDKFSNFCISDYSSQILSYLANAGLSIAINLHLFRNIQDNSGQANIFAKSVASSIIPSLLDLAGASVYEGFCKLSGTCNSVQDGFIAEE